MALVTGSSQSTAQLSVESHSSHAPHAADGAPQGMSDGTRARGRLERLWFRPAWLAPLAILTCFAGVSALLLANDPTDGRADPLGGCAFKLLTGLDCPGCGGTRAFWYLVHGNLPEAARHHLFAVFAAPFLVYMYVAWAGQRIFGWRLPQFRVTPRMAAGFAIGWGIYWVLRNLPFEPFTYLYV